LVQNPRSGEFGYGVMCGYLCFGFILAPYQIRMKPKPNKLFKRKARTSRKYWLQLKNNVFISSIL
jgi:hypothetical protein